MSVRQILFNNNGDNYITIKKSSDGNYLCAKLVMLPNDYSTKIVLSNKKKLYADVKKIYKANENDFNNAEDVEVVYGTSSIINKHKGYVKYQKHVDAKNSIPEYSNKSKAIKKTNISNNNVYQRRVIKKEDLESLTHYKFSINQHWTKDPFELFEKKEVISELQLLSGFNNHISNSHSIIDVPVEIVYYNKLNKHYGTFNISIHYCEKCNKYFDFYESFVLQMEYAHIELPNILFRATNSNNCQYEFPTNDLREHSKLNLLGYNVGKDMTSFKREIVLRKIIKSKLMTPSEIKNHLEFLIHLNINKENNRSAVSQWREDIHLVNKIIMEK